MSNSKRLRVFAVACLFALGLAPARAVDPIPEFDIRYLDGSVAIAADQIRSYHWATHTLTLAPKTREELAERLLEDRVVFGIPFAVTIGGTVAYKGTFTSALSSKSSSTPVIVMDAQALKPELGVDQLRIQLGYPTAEFFKGEDPRNDRRVREALKASGKLTEAEMDHTTWVAESLRQMETVKPGMTRADLLKVFREEGGLSTRLERRYAYRDCPYIKVDVRFEPVGALGDKSVESPGDKIISVSKPFLEWSIVD